MYDRSRTDITCGQLITIYLKNNPDKFHPDPISNDGSLGFIEDVDRPNKKNKNNNNNKTTRSMGSVAGPERKCTYANIATQNIQFKCDNFSEIF